MLKSEFKNILIEKPACFNKKEIKTLANLSKKNSASLYVAYNRRHYASIEKVLEIIKEDGGVLSFNFEFTEWSHVIRDLPHQQQLKDIWLLLNSTHVIDLAFFVGGYPKEMNIISAVI